MTKCFVLPELLFRKTDSIYNRPKILKIVKINFYLVFFVGGLLLMCKM